MSQSVTSSLYVKLVADAGDWESGMAAATSATQKFEAAAKKAARSPGLQSSIGSGEQAQIRKALELRQRYAGMGGDVAGPVRVTDKMVSDESERIILNRLVRSRNAEEQRAAAASAASNHIIMVQKSEAEAFALSERKKQAAIEQTAKVAAINAKIATVSSASRFENANPFAQQVLATQRLNALLAQRKTLTDEVARAQNRLAITEQVADVRSIRANLTAGSTVNRLRNLGSTAADNTGKYARFGVVMQQAGYQMQDFAVQVAGGQNKLVAFSQQGAQLLGVFGVGGAIAGAVLSTGVLIARMAGLGDEMGKQKTTVDSLAESFRQLAIAKNPSFSEKFASLDLNTAKNAYDTQSKLINNQIVEIKRLTEFKQKSIDTGLATPENLRGLDISISSAVKKYDDLTKELEPLQENLNKAGAGPAETARKAFEDRRDTIIAGIKAEQDSRKETYLSFSEARKQNTLDEMNNEQKLDYYIREMKFLESIGAKETANYEIAKKRTRELGTILLGQSGPKEIKTLDQYNKTVAGLQSKVPESLGLKQGALSSGLLVGGASPSALIDISQQILAGIRQLVNIEYMGQRSY